MKRAAFNNPFLDPAVAVGEPDLLRADPGAELREFLVLAYSTHREVTATFIAELCCHIVAAGGNVVDDLAYKTTRNASEHLKFILGREYGDPDLDYVETPVHSKQSSSRTSISMPIQLPSKIMQRELAGHIEPAERVEPQSSSCPFDCEAWEKSRLRKSTSLHWSRVVPVSLYVHGVQFGIRESFQGLCMRNLRTGVQTLVSIIRVFLSCKSKS